MVWAGGRRAASILQVLTCILLCNGSIQGCRIYHRQAWRLTLVGHVWDDCHSDISSKYYGYDLFLKCAEYSRTFMRIACHYLEGKDIHPVTPGEVSAGSAPLDASASDASSTTGEDSEEVRSVGSDRVRILQCRLTCAPVAFKMTSA